MTVSAKQLEQRVTQAAEAVLDRDGAVGPLELLQQLRFLEPVHVRSWRLGNEHFQPLEPHIQCGAEKLKTTYRLFAHWVAVQGLTPVEASYFITSAKGSHQLQITHDGDPDREQFFRTHFRRADLSPAKAKRVAAKLNKAPDLTVFQLTGDDTTCHECEAEIRRHGLLFMEQGNPICLTCADLDYLEFLPAGDAAMTRRSKKHSPLSAVVLRFNKPRKRYERQGILVASGAITQAEEECDADADVRAARREREAGRRLQADQSLVTEMTRKILKLYPKCPKSEAESIARHAAVRGSGRVGRSAAGRKLDDQAVKLAVVASIRHNHTNYDSLLMRGVERYEARNQIRGKVDEVFLKWS